MIDTIIYYVALTIMHATALAVVTWLLSVTLLRRARPAVKAALWTIVLIKFLIPPILPGEMTLSSWTTKTISAAGSRLGISAPQVISAGKSGNPETILSERQPDEPSIITLRHALIVCYFCGVAFFGIWSIVAYRRMRRSISTLQKAGDDIAREVEALASSVNLNCKIDVRITDRKTTPHVIGLRHAIMVLPTGLLELLETIERQALILHELAHIRRKDQIVRWLENVICVFLFFWPPVWVVCRRIERFTEMACDQWAIGLSMIDPETYARSLLDAVKSFSRSNMPSRRELAFAQNVRLLEERLLVVLEYRAHKSPGISRSLAVALAVWAVFALAGGSMAESPNNRFPQTIADNRQPVQSNAQTSSDKSMTASNQSRVAQAGIRPKRNPVSTEQQRSSSDPHQKIDVQTSTVGLTAYEQGFLLGQREAERRAREGSPAAEPMDNQNIQNLMKSKLDIERRVQATVSQSGRKE